MRSRRRCALPCVRGRRRNRPTPRGARNSSHRRPRQRGRWTCCARARRPRMCRPTRSSPHRWVGQCVAALTRARLWAGGRAGCPRCISSHTSRSSRSRPCSSVRTCSRWFRLAWATRIQRRARSRAARRSRAVSIRSRFFGPAPKLQQALDARTVNGLEYLGVQAQENKILQPSAAWSESLERSSDLRARCVACRRERRVFARAARPSGESG